MIEVSELASIPDSANACIRSISASVSKELSVTILATLCAPAFQASNAAALASRSAWLRFAAGSTAGRCYIGILRPQLEGGWGEGDHD